MNEQHLEPYSYERLANLSLQEMRELREKASKRRGQPHRPAFEQQQRSNIVPLSFAQERLWFINELDLGGAGYHMSFALRLEGELNVTALERSFSEVVRRHESLRTCFAAVDGVPVQLIQPPEVFSMEILDLSEMLERDRSRRLQQRSLETAQSPFDLTGGPPLRVSLLKLSKQEHVLLLTAHHIIADGWSLGILNRELGALYSAYSQNRPSPLSEPSVQYADYAIWQRQWLKGEILQKYLHYWSKQLIGAPPQLLLPTDRPRPAIATFKGALVGFEFPSASYEALRKLARDEGVTSFMALLATYQVLLSRYSGAQDVVVGAVDAGRTHVRTEVLIGFFVNMLALRTDLTGNPRFRELLRRVKEVTLDAYAHQELPFERLVEELRPERNLTRQAIFQAALVLQNFPSEQLDLPGLTWTWVRVEQETSQFDLALHLYEVPGGLRGEFEYATDLFDRETILRMAEHFRVLLDGIVCNPDCRIEHLGLLIQSEHERVLHEFNDTASSIVSDQLIHELFEEQVERTPDALAVVYEGASLTYGELNAKANQMARYLRKQGAQIGEYVPVLMPRCLQLLIAQVAVLKSGSVFVPVDPKSPVERQKFMIQDCGARRILADRADCSELKHTSLQWIHCADAAGAIGELPEGNLRLRMGAPPAYVMYTSGSTGTPKGVIVPHRAVSSLVINSEYAQIETTDCIAHCSNPAFDASTFEIWGALLNGASVLIVPERDVLEAERFEAMLSRHNVTVLWQTTALFNQRAISSPQIFSRLRYLLFGGEVSDPNVVGRVLRDGPPRHLLNMYGPTETTTFATSHLIVSVDGTAQCLPIGRPISNTCIYILDQHLQPVPIGVSGEIYIGGVGVALGYLNRPELTAERFLPDAFSADSQARMYKTGDLGRWRVDGTIEYLGRDDFQVKIRGHRIELGEIEARLRQHSGVSEAVVLAREDEPGEKRLVAYYSGSRQGASELRREMSKQLPEYMVPAAYVWLQSLPLSSNGKVDRKSMPAPDAQAYGTRPYEAPQGEMETALARIWAEVLKLERIGRHDSFFDLGGHSLSSVRVVSKVRQVLGIEVPLTAMWTAPRLTEFAEVLAIEDRAVPSPIEPLDRSKPLSLSFAQQRLWFMSQMEGGGEAYHVPLGLRLRGELNEEALRRSLDRLVFRHETLRTRFETLEGVGYQRIDSPETGISMRRQDLTAKEDAEARLLQIISEESQQRFDLQRGPMVRGRLIKMGPQDHVLLITQHHINTDGWSEMVLKRELGVLYGAYSRGCPEELPQLAVQYADYAAWQKRWLSKVSPQQSAYWRKKLADAPKILELPTDRKRPLQQDFSGAAVPVELDENLTTGLRALSQCYSTTLFMTVLTGWAIVLSRLSGQKDVVIGTVTASRTRAEIEGLIGFFVNTLALRIDLSGAPTVAEQLHRVRTAALGAQEHQDLPFEQVVEVVQPVRTLAHMPLCQVLLAWQNTEVGLIELPGLAVSEITVRTVMAKFDLELDLKEQGDRIRGELSYATALFDAGTMLRHVEYLRRVLAHMVSHGTQSISAIDMLSPAERHQLLVEWN